MTSRACLVLKMTPTNFYCVLVNDLKLDRTLVHIKVKNNPTYEDELNTLYVWFR